MTSSASRTSGLVACVFGAPVAAWLVALFVLHGLGGGGLYALLFTLAPFCITFLAARIARSQQAIPLAFLSAAIGLALWLITAIVVAPRVT
jgi:hypothetical protein